MEASLSSWLGFCSLELRCCHQIFSKLFSDPSHRRLYFLPLWNRTRMKGKVPPCTWVQAAEKSGNFSALKINQSLADQ